LIKKNLMKKFILIITASILLGLSPSAFAVTADDLIDASVGDDGLSVARCIAKGNTDFLLFLNSIIYSDGIDQGIIEPFNDAISRNQCQAGDISGLIRQRDKIRSYIREAFLTCDAEKLPAMKRGYNQVNAEIYYARHIVDSNVLANLPYEFLEDESALDNEALYYPRQLLYQQMYSRYVSTGKFSSKDFDVLFTKLEFKYSERRKEYIVCEHSSWDVVSEKWTEFIDNAAGIAPAIESLGETVAGRSEKIWEAATDYSYVDFYTSFVQLNLNNQTPKAGFEEIVNQLSEYSINTEFQSPSQRSVLSAISGEDFRFRMNTIKTELESRFTMLYRYTRGSSIKAFLSELDSLNKTLKNSFVYMDTVLTCVNTMNNRQCPGN
jgi:hypothetical protein